MSLGVFAQRVSDSTKIYILTCSPGTEIHQLFGHTAIYIYDENVNINWIFHYGTFNFHDPNFYVNFIKGKLDYMLGIENYVDFMKEYSSQKRDVWQIELNLTNEQKLRLIQYLYWKSQPENKYYLYDFFMDNCATRVRDVVERIYGDTLVYPEMEINKTFRQALMPYLRPTPWTRFGINLLLGLPAEKKLDYSTAMFLPDYVDSVFFKTKLKTGTTTQNLSIERKTMIDSDFKIGEKPFFNPNFVFWILAVALIFVSFYELKKHKHFKIIDTLLLFIVGLVGVLLVFMWFGTDHSPTKWNFNILWAVPTHVVVAFLIFSKKIAKFLRKYFLVFGILNALLAVTMWFRIPQQYDVAMFPLLIAFAVRFLRLAKGES